MMMSQSESEFKIIERYFNKNKSISSCITQGIGDDAAVVDVSNESNLVVSMDTLVSGVHFPESTGPHDIAYKALAVNLSDLAAMGATPAWFTLGLTFPEYNSKWLDSFSRGLFEIAEQFQIDLIGGDTTKGPLSITIQIAGYSADNKIMYRSGAKVNDDIYVSGTLGDAGAGLLSLNESNDISKSDLEYLFSRLNRPTPRIIVGQHICDYASACIDVSDGLIADLSHIIESSNCGAVINVETLPISQELRNTNFSSNYEQLALAAGDDYELCFCVPEQYQDQIKKISEQLNITLTKVGKIVKGNKVECLTKNKFYDYKSSGYQHFS